MFAKADTARKDFILQTLGLSDSTPRTESRIKTLFWPSINTGTDVDTLGTQGYWICTLVAMSSLLSSTIDGHLVYGVVDFLFFYLGGVGVRERSRYAATIVFLVFALSTEVLIMSASGQILLSLRGVRYILFLALLLSNLRATWIAYHWNPQSADATLPPRMSETLSDKLADALPAWLWPKARILYYVFSACLLLLIFNAVLVSTLRHTR